jgi:hypothetical protein
MWPGDLAPDDADLGSTDLLLAAVDKGDLLAQVEAVFQSVIQFLKNTTIAIRGRPTWQQGCHQHPRS